MTTDENLWGELPEADQTRLPRRILEAQAEILEKLTGGALIGTTSSRNISPGRCEIGFYIKAPALDNYIYHVLSVHYDRVNIYPISVRDETRSVQYDAESESTFHAVIAEILQTSELRKIIASILRSDS